MRRIVAWALAASMAGGVLAACAGVPGASPAVALHTQDAAQDMAIASINRAYNSLETARAAAQTSDMAGVISALQDARKHIENADVPHAFPQKREALDNVIVQLNQAVDRVKLLPRMGAMIDTSGVVIRDIIQPVAQSLNQAENALFQ